MESVDEGQSQTNARISPLLTEEGGLRDQAMLRSHRISRRRGGQSRMTTRPRLSNVFDGAATPPVPGGDYWLP